ncbi:MAG: ABC transporter ATP-binding protein [Acidobacteriota bacterium]
MIETHGLTQRYGRLTALDDLTLRVAEGEFYGFIGPNGAGKTTTIHILATLLQPTEGWAEVAGHDVRFAGREVRRLIGYLPDFFGVYPSLRVWEYLEFFAAAYEVPRSKRRPILDDVLELTGLEDKRDALVGSLSRGMQQRLGLARVLIHDPQVLLLDEPASGLDPRARLEVREILRELQAMGKTILLSSHILSELAEVCTAVGIIDRGRLLVSGPVDEVLAHVGPGETVRVEVAERPEAAATALGDLPATERVQVLSDGDGPGVLRVFLRQRGQAGRVAARLVDGGFGLQHLERERHDLEDLYLRLTDEESA